MNNVTPIEALMPHVSHEVICVACRFRYQACAPADVPLSKYQCPVCKEQGNVIKTGQEYNGSGKPEFI